MIKNEKAIREELTKQAKAKDWDDLAHEIMLLNIGIGLEKDPKYLILLNIKLEAWESEKASRVFDGFDMNFFLNKEFEDFSDDFVKKSNT